MCVTFKENELSLVNVRYDMVGTGFGKCVFRLHLEVVGLEMVVKNQQQAIGEEC
jgi:hypothetical protein